MKKRDYAILLHRLQAVGPTQIVAECGGYPVYALALGSGTEARILLTAGLHGDEPAGPEAALRFAEGLSPRLAQRCQFLILPCLNPHGYVHNTRENESGLDCNREFGGDAVPLVAQVKALLSALIARWTFTRTGRHRGFTAMRPSATSSGSGRPSSSKCAW